LLDSCSSENSRVTRASIAHVPPETDAKGKMHGFSINSAPDDPELTFTRAWLALLS
jgi:hypothetical protein